MGDLRLSPPHLYHTVQADGSALPKGDKGGMARMLEIPQGLGCELAN